MVLPLAVQPRHGFHAVLDDGDAIVELSLSERLRHQANVAGVVLDKEDLNRLGRCRISHDRRLSHRRGA